MLTCYWNFQVLQKAGKADKTTDDVFKDNVAAFQKQQVGAPPQYLKFLSVSW